MPACPRCGQENPDGFRFCGGCGADLAVQPPREVRKTVTILFADVTGSTALGERLDPEPLRRVMSRYFDEMKTVIEHHGGTVEKFIGDAVMAVFGIPRLHEDDALRALRAAAGMRDRLTALNDELEPAHGLRLEARIGVNTGEVVTGDAAAGQRLATGDAVNVAARLEQSAAPGEILVGEETLRLARAAVAAESAGSLAVKGKAEPLAAYRLVSVDAAAPAFERHLDAPLVGRRDELARVRAAFAASLAERRCRLVTVLGPPGIGKSRLARELAAVLEEEATVLAGNCRPYGEGITYWPLREIFAAAGAEDEFEAALGLATPEDTFWAIRKAVEARARERPLALVVEDIHWAEPTLLDLLEHLVDWSRDAPVLLVCLSRPELLDERPAWGAARPNADVLSLEPLADDETDELIAGLLDGSALGDEARARIRSTAEGNPLFVEQLLASLAEGGDAERTPPSLQALLAARVDALPEAERNVLERAAVAGMEFEWEALGHLAADGRRPTGATLASLARKELIRPHATRADWFAFRHALIRDAAYERIPKELRADLHERAARWLEQKDAELDALIGYHLEQATRLRGELGVVDERTQALADEAGRYLAAAARQADARFDVPAARSLAERALALLRDDAQRADLLFRLADMRDLGGEIAAAERAVRAAVAAAVAAGDPVLEWRARLELAFLAEDPGFLELAEEAVVVLERLGHERALLHAWMCVGEARLRRARVGDAAEAFERALDLAQRLGEWRHATDLIASFFDSLIRGPTPLREAIERSERALAWAARSPSLEAPGHVFLGLAYALDGRPDEGRRLYEHGQEVGIEIGADWPVAWSRAAMGARIELLAGDPVAAERELRAAIAAHRAMGEERTMPSFELRLAEALWAQGREEEGCALALGVEEPRRLGSIAAIGPEPQWRWRCVRAQALARTGEPADAERLAREAVDVVDETDCTWDRAEVRMALADVLRRAGEVTEAAEVTEEALALYEAKGIVAGAEHARAELSALS